MSCASTFKNWHIRKPVCYPVITVSWKAAMYDNLLAEWNSAVSLSHNFTGWQLAEILLFYFKLLMYLTYQSAAWYIILDIQFVKYFSFMSVFISTPTVSISHWWYNAVHIVEMTTKCVLFCVSSGSVNFAVSFISLKRQNKNYMYGTATYLCCMYC
jgi:hypothetical protein